MLNRIVIMGRLTRDPELRSTQSGVAVAGFTLAVDRDVKSKDTGEKATDFIDISAWRGLGEFVAKNFTKGQQAVVEGRLQFRDFTDKDGVKRRTAEVQADNVYFADRRRDTSGSAPATYGVAPASAACDQFQGLNEDYDSDLPY